MTPHFINLPFIMYMPRILSPTHSYLFQSCKSTLQILDDIVDMLGTNGQTDGVLLNALICQLLVSQLRMGCCCRMDNQALYICYVCQQGEELQVVDELMSFCLSALDLKGEYRSAAVRKIFLIQCMIRMIRQRRMINVLY